VPNEAQPLSIGDKPPLAISNAFGFGGHNVVLALEAA
jgi:3-oxoacyl-(acyl-carrier-protein) synthase